MGYSAVLHTSAQKSDDFQAADKRFRAESDCSKNFSQRACITSKTVLEGCVQAHAHLLSNRDWLESWNCWRLEFPESERQKRCNKPLWIRRLVCAFVVYMQQTCTDPVGGGAGGPDPPPPGKSQSCRVPYENWSGSHEKSQSYQDIIQYWATSSPPAKRHLNGVSLMGR